MVVIHRLCWSQIKINDPVRKINKILTSHKLHIFYLQPFLSPVLLN